ncbi:MAG: hypothetical protein KDJ65_16120 [Anaerolineae bacterium]|nr:hypothetical protein [Anaerolineae bacterium]
MNVPRTVYHARMNRHFFVFLALIGLILFHSDTQSYAAEPPMQIEAGAVDDFSSGINICTPPITPVTLSNPTVVTNCTQAGLQTALNSGGHIAFNCGPNPVTINITSPLVTSATEDTVIDGGGLITLNGGNSSRILEKPFTPNSHIDKTLGNDLTLQNIRFINAKGPSNTSGGADRGGAITATSPGTKLHIINATFENNHTSSQTQEDNQGGAIFAANIYETIIVGSVFENNTAGNGGAFGAIASGLMIYNSRFSSNAATDTTSGGIVRGHGGAIHLDGVTNSFNPDSNKIVDICGSTFADNTAIRGGGAIKTTISDNKGTKATYTRSTFTNNRLLGTPSTEGHGGAIYHLEDDHAGGSNEDNFELSYSTFTGNETSKQGGAAWIYVLGNGVIENSTFEGNSTTAPFNTVGQGGALVVSLGKIDITNVTFANNHASYQGGAIHGGGSGDSNRVITLKNTIFYNNTLNIGQTQPSETEWQGFHTNRRLADGGQNIQYPRYKPTYNNHVNNWITDAPIFADPKLSALADNGGFNHTMALQAGSPAINAGASGCPATDQRDAPRIGNCDIGAFEYNGVPPSITALTLSKRVTDLGGTLPYEETVAYEIELKNTNSVVASAVSLTDNLPGGVSFDGWEQQSGAGYGSGVVTWGPQDIAGGQSVKIVFTVDINAAAGTTINNSANFSSSNAGSGSAADSFVAGQPPEQIVFLPVIVQE